mmetsp:Transcript_13749/g.32332  ORF Transcript_13749/g.32332 Transcript_13749/m.32332 type:complete len:221 (-) Transcript_13749:331-993(-)
MSSISSAAPAGTGGEGVWVADAAACPPCGTGSLVASSRSSFSSKHASSSSRRVISAALAAANMSSESLSGGAVGVATGSRLAPASLADAAGTASDEDPARSSTIESGSSPSTVHQERRRTATATSCGVSRLAARIGRKASIILCAARSTGRPGPGSRKPCNAKAATSSSSGSPSQAAAEPRTRNASSSQSSVCECMSSVRPAAPPSFSLQLCAPKPSGEG